MTAPDPLAVLVAAANELLGQADDATDDAMFIRRSDFRRLAAALAAIPPDAVLVTADPRYRMIRVAPEVLEQFWTRTADGRRVTVDWGEPDEQGFHTPVFTATDDGNMLVTEASLAEALHETAPEAHKRRCRDRHDLRAAAILAALRAAK